MNMIKMLILRLDVHPKQHWLQCKKKLYIFFIITHLLRNLGGKCELCSLGGVKRIQLKLIIVYTSTKYWIATH